MIRYSLQPRDSIFVEGYGFLFFARNMGKNIARNISENVSINTIRKFLVILNNLLQMQLKLLQKERFKKQQKQLVISLALLLELQESKKLCH